MTHALMRSAQRLYQTHRYDLIFGVPMEAAAEAAVRIARQLRKPAAAMAIGSDVMVCPERIPAVKNNISWTIENADLIVGVCKSICTQLSLLGNAQQAPVCVYLGRDTTSFAPAPDKEAVRNQLKIPHGAVIGVFVGNLIPSKGLVELAQVVEEIHKSHPRFQLICVGEGICRVALLKVNERAKKEVIRLPGAVAPADVPKYLQAADFFAFPSHSEGMPQALLEAMNCGLAPIATRVGGIPEAVMDGDSGLLVDPRNAPQLATAMTRMIVDATFRIEAGKKSYQIARAVFDPMENAKHLGLHLRSICH